jgi:hypothetical protein
MYVCMGGGACKGGLTGCLPPHNWRAKWACMRTGAESKGGLQGWGAACQQGVRMLVLQVKGGVSDISAGVVPGKEGAYEGRLHGKGCRRRRMLRRKGVGAKFCCMQRGAACEMGCACDMGHV